jgi:2-polyprenyl-3-methyl-5-hydroxy-6-metoxy-1,4-benzoquinol methylase
MNPLPKENIYGHTKKLQFVIEQVNRYIKLHGKPVSILDFGCGNGIAVSQYLIQEGIRFYGVDIHEPSLRYAREHFENENAFFVNHVPEEILFDIIVYADILEHLDCPVTILQQHHDRLKEHGLIIGSVPNGYGPFEIERRMDKWFNLSAGFRLAVGIKRKLRRSSSSCATIIAYNTDSEHVQFFKKTSLRSSLQRSGFLVQCFKNGPFLGGPLTERLLRGQWMTRMNSNIGDLLPYWLASTWYFTAKKKRH